MSWDPNCCAWHFAVLLKKNNEISYFEENESLETCQIPNMDGMVPCKALRVKMGHTHDRPLRCKRNLPP